MAMSIEGMVYFLLLLDVIIYTGMTITKNWHKKKTHIFWKNIPLDPFLNIYFLVLAGWLGFALYRLGFLF